MKMEIKARLDKSQNVTVSLDAWPDTAGRFVFCCTVALPDRYAPAAALQLAAWQHSLKIWPVLTAAVRPCLTGMCRSRSSA